MDWDLGNNMTLTSLTSISDYDREEGLEADGTIYQNYEVHLLGEVESQFQELRLSGTFGQTGNWVIGTNYESTESKDDFLASFGYATVVPYTFFTVIPFGPTVTFNNQETDTTSFFGSVDFSVNDNWAVTLGARYTEQERESVMSNQDNGDGVNATFGNQIITYNQILSGQPVIGGNAVAGGSWVASQEYPFYTSEKGFARELNEDNFSWKLGTTYSGIEDALFWFNLTKGFKSGSFPTIGATTTLQYNPVVQEEILAYELGGKISMLDNRMQLNAAVFYYDYKDKQVVGSTPDPILGPLPTLINVPDAEVTGIDVSIEWYPIEGLRIAPAFTYVDSEVGQYRNWDTFAGGANSGSKNFTGQPDHVVNFFVFIANEVREIMAELGIRKFNDLIGRRDLLDFQGAESHWKAHGLDLAKLIVPLDKQDEQDFFNSKNQDHQLEKALDNALIKKCKSAILDKEKVSLKSKIVNTNRTVGGMLSGVIAKKYGHNGLPNNTINIDFEGSAGQSFGAWLAKGISFNLEGDANDYVGKGLSGGKISVFPHSKSKIIADDNIIAGNTLLYGAISGECYLSGVVGERFAVRNSGATAVVEGCGDHGCEYMTGGIVVVLGKTGRNFAAGMSGGIAYILDEDNSFDANCNKSMVDLEKLSNNEMNSKHTEKEINSDLLDFDISRLKLLINRHYKNTKSEKAKIIINDWEKFLPQFIKITPFEFRRALIERKQTLTDENTPSRIAGE